VKVRFGVFPDLELLDSRREGCGWCRVWGGTVVPVLSFVPGAELNEHPLFGQASAELNVDCLR